MLKITRTKKPTHIPSLPSHFLLTIHQPNAQTTPIKTINEREVKNSQKTSFHKKAWQIIHY